MHRYVALVRRAIDADPTNEALQQRLIEGLRQTERDTDADQQVELAARLNSAARDEMMADYYDRIQRANRAACEGVGAVAVLATQWAAAHENGHTCSRTVDGRVNVPRMHETDIAAFQRVDAIATV